MLGIIFDMDGTLLDTQRIFIDAWDAVGLNYGIKNLGEHIQFVCGMNDAGWYQYLAERFPTLDLPTFHKEVADYIKRNLTVRFKGGAEALLAFLKERHIPIAVASGSSRALIEHHLGALQSLPLFDAIVGGDEVENSKPAPDIFLRAAKLMGCAPEECIVFEDSPNGIGAACNAGMRCIGIPDVAPFTSEIESTLFARLASLDEAIPLIQKEL